MAYADDVIADAPVAYYKIHETDGEGVAVDSSGAGWDGTHTSTMIRNVIGPIAGETDWAAFYRPRFSAFTDSAQAAALAFSTDATIEMWAMWRDGAVLLRDSTNAGGWMLAYDNSGTIQIRAGGTAFNTGVAASALKDGAWHHIVLTKAGGAVKFYIDAVNVYSGTGAASTAAVTPWRVCRNGTSGSLIYASAACAHLALYDYALTAAQVAAHHRAAVTFNEILAPRTGATRLRHIRHTDNATPVEFAQSAPTSSTITSTSPKWPGTGIVDLGSYTLGTEIRFHINASGAQNNLSDRCVVAYYPTPPPPGLQVHETPEEITGPCFVLWWEDVDAGGTPDYNDVMTWLWQPALTLGPTVGYIGPGLMA